MKKLLVAALLAAAVAGVHAEGSKKAAAAPKPDAPLATVNGVAIPEMEARIMISDRMAAGASNTPELQAAVRNALINRELLAQQARKAGLAANPVLATRIHMAAEDLYAQAYAQEYVAKHPPTEEQITKAYETTKEKAGSQEYHVRHIVVDSEEAAKAIIARLQGGAKFADVAAESKDPAARANGGDMGWLNRGNLLPQMAPVVTGLGKGKFTTQPVHDASGWHVIMVEDVRPFAMPPLDDRLRQQFRNALGRQALEAHLAELAKSAKIE
ncbi:MAG TPA: peptidylprolyl isomerase [Rhodocyclaceae bacterium]